MVTVALRMCKVGYYPVDRRPRCWYHLCASLPVLVRGLPWGQDDSWGSPRLKWMG